MSNNPNAITLSHLAFIIKNMKETLAIELNEIEGNPVFMMAEENSEYEFLKEIAFPEPTSVSIKHLASDTKYFSMYFEGSLTLREQTDTGQQSLVHLLAMLKLKSEILINIVEDIDNSGFEPVSDRNVH